MIVKDYFHDNWRMTEGISLSIQLPNDTVGGRVQQT
jgi:hypothetical protein